MLIPVQIRILRHSKGVSTLQFCWIMSYCDRKCCFFKQNYYFFQANLGLAHSSHIFLVFYLKRISFQVCLILFFAFSHLFFLDFQPLASAEKMVDSSDWLKFLHSWLEAYKRVALVFSRVEKIWKIPAKTKNLMASRPTCFLVLSYTPFLESWPENASHSYPDYSCGRIVGSLFSRFCAWQWWKEKLKPGKCWMITTWAQQMGENISSCFLWVFLKWRPNQDIKSSVKIIERRYWV